MQLRQRSHDVILPAGAMQLRDREAMVSYCLQVQYEFNKRHFIASSLLTYCLIHFYVLHDFIVTFFIIVHQYVYSY